MNAGEFKLDQLSLSAIPTIHLALARTYSAPGRGISHNKMPNRKALFKLDWNFYTSGFVRYLQRSKPCAIRVPAINAFELWAAFVTYG
jgi:hypothetical protein